MDKNTDNKILRTVRTVLIVLVAFVAVFFIAVRIYFRAPVHSYYKISEKAFVIPGIRDGFIGQGITYDSDNDYFFVTGYMKDHSASPIYIMNRKTKKLVKTIKMMNPDGSAFDGHAGGLTVFGNMVYVAGSENCCLYGFEKKELLSAENNSNVTYCEIVSLSSEKDLIGVAFTTTHNDMLYAGEFYRLPAYPTLDSHIVSCCDGENHAIMVGLKKQGNTFVPSVAYSLPGNVQGLSFANGKIYVSTSWGVGFSHIYCYDESKLVQQGTINLIGKELPLFVLDSNSLCQTYKTPPMSEEIEYVDGQFYTMCESASNKYIFGKFSGGKWCYKVRF